MKRLLQDHWPIFLLSNISSLTNLLLPLVLVRILNPSEIGVYKTFFLYLTVLPFLALAGGPVHSVYYWIGLEEKESDQYIKTSWLVTVFLSSFILLIGLPLAPLLHEKFHLTLPVFIMLLVSGFLVCPSGHFPEACIARGKKAYGAFLSVLFELLKTAGFILLAWWYREIEYLFSYFFLMMILSFILMTYLGLKNNALTFRIDKAKFKEILKYSLPMSLASALHFVIEKSDLLILSSTLSSEMFAYYSLGCLIIPPLFILDMSVQKVMLPKISQSFRLKRNDDIKREFKKGVSDIAYLMIPSFFGLVFFAPQIVELLYTKDYAHSALYLQIFAFSYLLMIFPHDAILRGTGKTQTVLKISLILAPLALISAYFLSLTYGAGPALIATLVIKATAKGFCLKASGEMIGKKIYEMIPLRRIMEFTLVASCLTLLSYSVKPYFENKLEWFLITAPLFALFYIGYFQRPAFKRALDKIRTS